MLTCAVFLLAGELSGAPPVPWSIVAVVPPAAEGAPSACVLTACYRNLIPPWDLVGKGAGAGKRG